MAILIPARSKGRQAHTGLRHLLDVERKGRAREKALCGAGSRLGWLVNPRHAKRNCAACVRQAAMLAGDSPLTGRVRHRECGWFGEVHSYEPGPDGGTYFVLWNNLTSGAVAARHLDPVDLPAR